MPAQDSQGRYITPAETLGGGAAVASAARTATDTPSFTFAITATSDRDA